MGQVITIILHAIDLFVYCYAAVSLRRWYRDTKGWVPYRNKEVPTMTMRIKASKHFNPGPDWERIG